MELYMYFPSLLICTYCLYSVKIKCIKRELSKKKNDKSYGRQVEVCRDYNYD